MSSVKTKNVEDFSTKLTIFFQITKFLCTNLQNENIQETWNFKREFKQKMEILSITFAFQVHTVPNKVDQKKLPYMEIILFS